MMKERPGSKQVRGARQESRRFRQLVIVVGFFLVSLTFVVVSKPDAILFGLNGKLPADEAPASILIQQPVDKAPVVASRKNPSDALGGDPKVVDDEVDVKPKAAEEDGSKVLSEPDPASGMTEPAPNKDANGHKPADSGGERKGEDPKHRVTLPTVSNYTIHDADDAKQEGGYYLMSCIKDVPTLRGENYSEWRKKLDLAFVCVEADWVVDTPQPVKANDPERETADDDAAWEKKKEGLCYFGDVIYPRKHKVATR